MEKSTLLTSALKSKEAQQVVSHYIPSGDYSSMVKALTDRYDRPETVFRTRVKSLITYKTIEDNLRSWKEVEADLMNNLKILETTKGVTIGDFLISAVEICMSTDVFNLCLITLFRAPTTADLEIFCRRRLKRAEAATMGKPITTRSSVSTQAHPFTYKKPVKQVLVTKYSRTCAACGRGDHMPYHCEVFKALTVSERGEKVMELVLCKNCFVNGHRYHECRSRYSWGMWISPSLSPPCYFDSSQISAVPSII